MNLPNAIREMRTIKALLNGAEAEARAMGEEHPAAEHLLLAAFDLPDGSARRIFARFGTDLDGLRGAIAQLDVDALVGLGMDPERAVSMAARQPLDPEQGRSRIYRSAPTAQEAFQAAAALARASKPSHFSGAHVVAAVAAMEQGTTARALRALGIERHELAAAAQEEMAAPRAVS